MQSGTRQHQMPGLPADQHQILTVPDARGCVSETRFLMTVPLPVFSENIFDDVLRYRLLGGQH